MFCYGCSVKEKTAVAVLIGNGKSISRYSKSQFEDLFGRVDVMSISGAFKLWNEFGVFPRYHYFGREMDDIWGKDEIDKFFELTESAGTTVFVKDSEYLRHHGRSNVVLVKLHPMPVASPDISRWYHALEYDMFRLENALKQETDESNVEDAVIDFVLNGIDEKLNWRGMLKVFHGSESLDAGDYIPSSLPRFVSNLAWPESVDRFYYEHGQSGVVAARLLQLLGYGTTLLLGCDSRYRVNADKTMNVAETHGIKNVFNGKPYFLSRDIDCEDCQNEETLNIMMRNSWVVLKAAIEYNNLEYEIIDCTEDGALDVFPKSELETELSREIVVDKRT